MDTESSMRERFVYDDSRTWWYALEPFFWKEFYDAKKFKFIGEKTYAPSDATIDELRNALAPLTIYEGKNYTGTKVEQFFIRDADENPEYIGVVRAKQGKLEVLIAAEKREVADKVIEHFDTLWPPAKTVKEDVVPYWFWTMTGTGPSSYKRKLTTCKWPEIEQNYVPATKDPLALLHERKPPFQGGRLILWHGPPGTGKTYAIRSLTHRWKGWCKAQYIMDPDRFFQSADYMMQVMMGRENDGYDPDEDMEVTPEVGEDGKLPDKHKWNLIIAEDAEEFLKEDAKQREGQAVARLLNTTDGLIGQGLKVLILITTNVDIQEVHPAIKRSGRCLSNMSFDPFDGTRANMWLQDKGLSADAIDAMWKDRRQRRMPAMEIVLADMYEQLEEKESRRILGAEREVVTTGQYL